MAEVNVLLETIFDDEGKKALRSKLDTQRYHNQMDSLERVKGVVELVTILLEHHQISEWNSKLKIHYIGAWTGPSSVAPQGSEVIIRWTQGEQGGTWQFKLNGSRWQSTLYELWKHETK